MKALGVECFVRESSAWMLGQFRIMPEIDATNWFTWHDSTLSISGGGKGACGKCRAVRLCGCGAVWLWGCEAGGIVSATVVILETLIFVFLSVISFALANFGAFSH